MYNRENFNRENFNKENSTKENEKLENQQIKNDIIVENGSLSLESNRYNYSIKLISIIGEIEGHEVSSETTKTTKYEHILPALVAIEDDQSINGVLVILQTTGGDCSAGLAIAEMIASLSKPTVSLVIGDSHSIGVPLAVATDYSFIVPSGTMVVHPVRMSGTIIGAPQTLDYFKIIQDRIVGFVEIHSNITNKRYEELMLAKGIMTKDLGTILVGENAVKEGLIDEVGGLKEAMNKLYTMIDNKNK